MEIRGTQNNQNRKGEQSSPKGGLTFTDFKTCTQVQDPVQGGGRGRIDT